MSIRQFAQIIGTLVALDPDNAVGSVFWRRPEIEKGLRFKEAKGEFETIIDISEQTK